MDSRDFISRLPDDVLGKILCLLPTRLAVSTSVLSRRWRNLFLLVENFDLEDSSTLSDNGFSDFMERTVSLLKNTCPIKRLSLNCGGDYEPSTVERWIRTAFERGCLELRLQSQCGHSLGIGVFSSSNRLVKLTLSDGINVDGDAPPKGTVFFPVLRTLFLGSVVADRELHDRLISGCPLLQELFIRNPNIGPTVSSVSIKRLVIFFHLPHFTWAYKHEVSIKTPNLMYLDYSGFVSEGYDVVYDLRCLVEARLDIRLWDSTTIYDFGDYADAYEVHGPEHLFDDVFGNVTSLVYGIRYVMALHLSPHSLEAFHFCCNFMPVFYRLSHLSFESDKDKGWQSLPLLINNSPYLHTLVIKGLVHRVTSRCGDACSCISMEKKKKQKKKKKKTEICCLSLCPVKVLVISGFRGSLRELKQMEHFLGKLAYLQTVNVGIEEESNNGDYLRAALKALPAVSPKCKIQFF